MASKRKKKTKWIQAANRSMEKRGTKGSYGHHSEKQMNKDIRGGGKLAKKAQFAKNMRKIAKRRKRRGSKRKARR